MRIGELSKVSGITPRMLRYYEENGLLMPNRSISNYRLYEQSDVVLLKNIITLQEAGLTLVIIKTLLPCIKNEQYVPLNISIKAEPCLRVIKTLQEEKNRIESMINVLNYSKKMINQYLKETLGE